MEILELKINGRKRTVAVEKSKSLLYVLREVLDMTGTKCGCNTGDCGACKIIVDGEAVNACSLKAGDAVGKDIVTIEGICGEKGELHPIQQAFIDCGAVQCGYCIPGMVVCAKALLDKTPDPDEAEIREALKGNLCRCTGYNKIITAIKTAAKRLSADNSERGGK